MILIGSRALELHGLSRDRKTYDFDVIMDGNRLPALLKTVQEGNPDIRMLVIDGNHIALRDSTKPAEDRILDVELAWDHSSGALLLDMARGDRWALTEFQFHGVTMEAYVPPLEVLYQLKLSHRYKRNSPHFAKTMHDIHRIRDHAAWCKILLSYPSDPSWYTLREKETYDYHHPKLRQGKSEFFSNDNVQYKYDHDTLHLAVKHDVYPAYQAFSVPGQEVLSSRGRFDVLPAGAKLNAVLEEAYVLALERSQIPFNFQPDPKKSFDMALEKVCTSITSGWFREFAWENYHAVRGMYDLRYVDWFHHALKAGTVKEFKA